MPKNGTPRGPILLVGMRIAQFVTRTGGRAGQRWPGSTSQVFANAIPENENAHLILDFANEIGLVGGGIREQFRILIVKNGRIAPEYRRAAWLSFYDVGVTVIFCFSGVVNLKFTLGRLLGRLSII